MVLFSSVQFLSAWTKSFMSAIITNLISVLERNSFHHVQDNRCPITAPFTVFIDHFPDQKPFVVRFPRLNHTEI